MRVARFIAVVIAALWIFTILWAADYSFIHGCSGSSGNNIDGFLPAFALAPIGVPAAVWSLLILFRATRAKKDK